jgi:hypothetical protein
MLGARLSNSYNIDTSTTINIAGRQQVRLQLGIRQAATGMRLKHLHTTTTPPPGATLFPQHQHTIRHNTGSQDIDGRSDVLA